MGFGLLNAALAVGVAGAAIPVLVHLWNRGRDPVVDWGAMAFLDLGRRTRNRIRVSEWLLLLTRMAILAAVALALARPFFAPGATGAGWPGGAGPRRDAAIVLDGSASMGRGPAGATPRDAAIAWARRFVAGMAVGDSTAVLMAKDRVRPLVPPSFDRARLDAALADAPPARGSSDLPAALAEAFRVLGSARNPGRDVILLTDGQRLPWRPGEAGRWRLLGDIRARSAVAPRVWSVAFRPGDAGQGAVVSVASAATSRGVLTPGMPAAVTAEVANAGPGPATRTAELRVDGRAVAGSSQWIGPIPPGGRSSATFRAAVSDPGSHLLTVRLRPEGGPTAADDEASVAVRVAPALSALLVEGRPTAEPLGGAVDFLRIALAPAGDDAPLARATAIPAASLDAESLRGRSFVVLADVARLTPATAAALGRYVAEGGGLLIAPGGRTDAADWNARAGPAGAGWLPARLGALKGDPAARKAEARPAPRSFAGPALAALGEGDAPPLAGAGLFSYRVLEPVDASAVVSARLDTGDPWAVERPHGRGRVLLLAAGVDAAAGTLPVNPDFVPLVHEWAAHLGGTADAPHAARPGESLLFDLDPAPPPGVSSLPLQSPDGRTLAARVDRSTVPARARCDDATEPGAYQLSLADPPGGFAYAVVRGDPRESDPAPLDPAEMSRLAELLPLTFEPDPAALSARLTAPSSSAGRREAWRTRRMARGRGYSP